MANLGTLVAKLTLDHAEFIKNSGDVQQRMQKLGSGMTTAGMGASAAFTAPIVAGAAIIGNLANEAIGHQGRMNEVFTLLPGVTKQAMGEMSADVLDFSKNMGVLPEEVVPALYQAISAGVPADNVFDFLETAQKAAVGGVTDLTSAVDAISTVVNSYGADVMDAGKASDLMFTAVRLGKTTFEELGKSLFQVLPTASALGVGFEDVTGAMATMTAQGVPTSVATTQMRQMLVELSKEGGKTSTMFKGLAGQSFKDFIAGGGDVAGALALLQGHAEGAGLGINDLFGSVEAGNAALALSGANAQAYIQNVEEMQNAAGATDAAFATMEEGVGRQMEKLKAEFAAAKIEIGDKFLPIIVDTLLPVFRDQVMPMIQKVGDFIAKLAEKFGALSPTTQKIILVVIALVAALRPVLMIAGMMVSAISALIPVFALLLGPVGLVIAILAALIAVGILVYKNWDKIKEFAINIWGGIKDFFSDTWESIKAIFQTALDAVLGFIDEWGGWIVAAFFGPIGLIVKLIIDNWEAIKEFTVNIWESIKGFFVKTWEAIKGFFIGIWDSMKTAVTDRVLAIYNDVKLRLEGLWDYIKGLPAKALQWGKNILNSLWNGMKSIFGNIRTWFQNNVVKLLNRLNPWSKSSPSLIDNIRSGVSEIEGLYRSIKLPEMSLQPSLARGGGTISPTHKTAAGGGIVININGPISSEKDADYYANYMVKRLRLEGIV